MEWVQLENGVNMPRLGLGVWNCGAQTEQAVLWALEAGYRHVDTAAMYGNEAAVGRAVRESGLPRADLFITTKVWTEDVRRGRAREALMESLDRLGMDYVDLFLIHWPAENFERAWEDMTVLCHEGWCRAIGVANFEEEHLAALDGVSDMKPLVNQVESHPGFANGAVLARTLARGAAPVAHTPLGRGTVLASEAVRRVAKKYGRTPAQVVLRWQLQRGFSVIPRSVNPEHITENGRIFDFKLRRKDVEALDAIPEEGRLSADPRNFHF